MVRKIKIIIKNKNNNTNQNIDNINQNLKIKSRFHIVINNRYILGSKIGSGSFGDVYYGIDKQPNERSKYQYVAIKLEKIANNNF